MTEREIEIDAPGDVVYRLVSDPMRMAEWSPETARCRWVGRATAAHVGARFRGTSRNGRRRWTTTSRITEMEPGRRFAWEVTYFRRPVARWEYRVEPAASGVRLVEAVHDQRGRLLRTVSPIITGSADRNRRNGDTMESTLQAVKAAAEAEASA